MKAFRQISALAAFVLGALFVLPFPVTAAPISPAAPPLKSAVPLAPYSLILSLSSDKWSTVDPGSPELAVTIINSGPNTLAFVLEGWPLCIYTVDYKSDTAATAQWKPLKSNLPPSPFIFRPGHRTQTSTYCVLVTLSPGERYEAQDRLIGFDLSAKGLYQITAVQVPNVTEWSGPGGARAPGRRFDLDARSNSIVVCRTSYGLLPVP